MLTRIVTAVLAGSVALAAILWREPFLLIVLLLVMGGIAAWEGYQLLGRTWADIGGIALMVAAYAWIDQNAPPAFIYGVGALWLMGNLTLFVRFPDKWPRYSLLAMVILAMALSSASLYNASPDSSSSFAPSLLLLAWLPLWVGDSLAYFVGKSIGRHKLAPSISPNKTWEGAVANLMGCLGASLALGAWLAVPTPASLAVGLSTGILGQIGDLLQSRLKRFASVKDSGSILPGHGGVLDRLDSFLFSSYPSLLALWLMVPEAFHVKQWPW